MTPALGVGRTEGNTDRGQEGGSVETPLWPLRSTIIENAFTDPWYR